MGKAFDNLGQLPSPEQIHLAIRLYFEHAYPAGPPEQLAKFLPPDGFEPGRWLMSDFIERDPAGGGDVRSYVLRMGNSLYPHMKLRLSRPPRGGRFLFTVDCHDAFLSAKENSPDRKVLEELKKHNAAVAGAVLAAWDAAGLPTERSYLRERIQQARARKGRE